MDNDQRVPEPQCVRLDVFIKPLFASGSERAEQENGTFIANQNVWSIRNNS